MSTNNQGLWTKDVELFKRMKNLMAPPSDSMNHNDRLKGLSNREVGNALMSVSLKRPMPHEGEVCGYTPSQICYGYHVFNVCNVPVVQHIYDMHVLCCMM